MAIIDQFFSNYLNDGHIILYLFDQAVVASMTLDITLS